VTLDTPNGQIISALHRLDPDCRRAKHRVCGLTHAQSRFDATTGHALRSHANQGGSEMADVTPLSKCFQIFRQGDRFDVSMTVSGRIVCCPFLS
jgi:hypothetical protein